MKIHYFQRYHGKENVHTSNAMLLLSRLYQYSPSKFYEFLGSILPDNADIELEFIIQEKTSSGTILDAAIKQSSFKIAIETKLWGNFAQRQLEGHIAAFKNEDFKVLLTLDPNPIKPVNKTQIDKLISDHNKKANDHIVHKHLTFESIINQVGDVIDERDYEMQDVLNDYREYCYSSGLVPNDWKRMRVRLAGTTLDSNRRLSLYYDGMGRNLSGPQYLGLYNQKTVKAIGKIIAIAVIMQNGDALDVENEVGAVTDDMKARVWKAIEDANNYGYSLQSEKHRYFFVEEFFDTDFKKTSKGSLMGSKVFDLCDTLNLDKLPDTAIIADLLRTREWQ